MEKELILNWLREVEHPAKGDKNVVELGMVENIVVSEKAVSVTLAFSKHRDPLAEYLIGSTKAAIIRNAPEGTAVEVKTIIKNDGWATPLTATGGSVPFTAAESHASSAAVEITYLPLTIAGSETSRPSHTSTRF